MSNILVTGGCGYVGSMLVPALLADGHKVTTVDIMWFGNFLPDHKDLTVIKGDVREIDSIPMKGFDSIIHLANIANDPSCDIDSKISWEINVLASKFLIEKAIKNKVHQFIYASSGSVYGVKDEPEVTEDLDLVPISDYNKTKMISERVFLSYKESILVQIVRPATICGTSPRQRLDLSVNILTYSALKNGKIKVFGGDQTRPNIHMKDMIRVYQYFLSREDLSGIYNAGFENISIMDIAKMVTKHLPVGIEVSESNDPRSYRQNSDKLIATGFVQKYGVEDGIKEIIEAYKAGTLRDDDNCYNIKTMKKILTTA
ncbi:MAG: oxidoreductase [Lentisphaerae bacterium GWF2_49_21]|nr:MAG: oxidoreductase [Lentisphaerae bacterium GWF2_49_21]